MDVGTRWPGRSRTSATTPATRSGPSTTARRSRRAPSWPTSTIRSIRPGWIRPKRTSRTPRPTCGNCTGQGETSPARLAADQGLGEKNANTISDAEAELAETTHISATAATAVGDAAVVQAKAARDQSKINLGYCTIKSPVKGVIIDRRVNVGQTVVASLNSPSLFLIAKDLKRMQVWASVNEADIGTHPLGPDGDLHRRRLPRQGVQRQVVRPAAAQRQHDAERGHLHRGGQHRQLRTASCCRT